jgi:hypothetical protein
MLYSHHNKKMSFKSYKEYQDNGSKGLFIEEASYGQHRSDVPDDFTNVTKEVRNLVKNDKLYLKVGANALGVADPAPGVKKKFIITFVLDGNRNDRTLNEGEKLVIGTSDEITDPAKLPGNQILQAVWYTFVAFIGSYVVMSFYRLGSEGFGGGFVGGIILALFSGMSVLGAGLAPSGANGVFAVLMVSLGIFQIVFFTSLYDPNYINFKYAYQTVGDIVQQ